MYDAGRKFNELILLKINLGILASKFWHDPKMHGKNFGAVFFDVFYLAEFT